MIPGAPGQACCPECGKAMGPGMSLCPPCAAARRRRQARPSREFNPWFIALGVLLAGLAIFAHRIIAVTIPHMKAGRAIETVRTHDIQFSLNRSEQHYSIEQVITHYDPTSKVFKPNLLPLGMKPEDPATWSATRRGSAYNVVCRFRGEVFSFKLTGSEIQSTDANGQAILDQEGNMIDIQPSLPSSAATGGL